MDFALAFAVVHEVPDAPAFFSGVYKALAEKGKLLVAEPKGRVSAADFKLTVADAEKNRFKAIANPRIGSSRTVLLQK